LRSISKHVLNDVFNTLYKSMNDYALDRRGDVGSWVREESMRTLHTLVKEVASLGE
jgi:hypothetical protein